MKRGRAVVLGGGGGASVALRAIPDSYDKTAIIAVTDTGRSTGVARHIGGNMPAPGDIRATIAAHAQHHTMAQLLQHRFDGHGDTNLNGMALGNLMLAALYRESGDFGQAVATLAQLAECAVTVLPVTAHSTQLCAHLIDGSDHVGEVAVRAPHKAPIAVCRLDPPVAAYPAACQAIVDADVVVIGPGSFFTTIHAVLLPDGIRDALHQCRGKVVFVSNTTTQTGQTEHLDNVGHVAMLVALLGSGVLDAVLLNNRLASRAQVARLAAEGLAPLDLDASDVASIAALGVRAIPWPLIESDGADRTLWNKQDTLRHDARALRAALLRVLYKGEDNDDRS
jgi:uncharacterized cofD-like protein